MTIRSYSELCHIEEFEDRFDYLALNSSVGASTFGFERYINQNFYTSAQWKSVRHEVIARDEGMDLGVMGYEIFDRVIIHHMNPMTVEDIENGNADILNPEFLICTSHRTHNAIHFGNKNLLAKPFVERRRGDTTLW